MSAEKALQVRAIDPSRNPVLIRVASEVSLGTGRGPGVSRREGRSNPVGDAGPEIANGLGAFVYAARSKPDFGRASS